MPQFFDVVWCKAPIPSGHDMTTAQVYLRPGHFVAVMPSYDGRLQIGWVIDKGTFGELRRHGAEYWIDALSQQVSPTLARHLQARRSEVSAPFLLNAICDRLLEWTRPGLLLLGDAAHPMSPIGGQGINVAFRDVLVAANHLVPLLRQEAEAESIDLATRAIQDERMPEITLIQGHQQRQAQFILGRTLMAKLVLRLMPQIVWIASRLRMTSKRSRVFTKGATVVRLIA